MLCDTHTHLAPYSHDASQTIGELLAAAEAQGLAAVCTADHYEKDLFYAAGREDIFDPAGYFHDLLPVQAKQAQSAVRLFLGAELGYLPHLVDHLAGFAAAWPFDEIILSLHILDMGAICAK
jgi:histidinol-phosphatase (PHP family)